MRGAKQSAPGEARSSDISSGQAGCGFSGHAKHEQYQDHQAGGRDGRSGGSASLEGTSPRALRNSNNSSTKDASSTNSSGNSRKFIADSSGVLTVPKALPGILLQNEMLGMGTGGGDGGEKWYQLIIDMDDLGLGEDGIMQACLDNTGRLLQATGSRPSMTDLLRSHGSGSSMFRPECSSVKRGQVGGVWVAYHPVTASTAASRHIACVTLSVDGCDGSVAVAVSGTTAPPPPTHPPPPPSPRHRWNFSAWSLLRRKRIGPEQGEDGDGGWGGESDEGGGAAGGEGGSGDGGGGRGGVGGGQGQPLMFNDVGLNQWVDAVCRVANGSDRDKQFQVVVGLRRGSASGLRVAAIVGTVVVGANSSVAFPIKMAASEAGVHVFFMLFIDEDADYTTMLPVAMLVSQQACAAPRGDVPAPMSTTTRPIEMPVKLSPNMYFSSTLETLRHRLEYPDPNFAPPSRHPLDMGGSSSGSVAQDGTSSSSSFWELSSSSSDGSDGDDNGDVDGGARVDGGNRGGGCSRDSRCSVQSPSAATFAQLWLAALDGSADENGDSSSSRCEVVGKGGDGDGGGRGGGGGRISAGGSGTRSGGDCGGAVPLAATAPELMETVGAPMLNTKCNLAGETFTRNHCSGGSSSDSGGDRAGGRVRSRGGVCGGRGGGGGGGDGDGGGGGGGDRDGDSENSRVCVGGVGGGDGGVSDRGDRDGAVDGRWCGDGFRWCGGGGGDNSGDRNGGGGGGVGGSGSGGPCDSENESCSKRQTSTTSHTGAKRDREGDDADDECSGSEDSDCERSGWSDGGEGSSRNNSSSSSQSSDSGHRPARKKLRSSPAPNGITTGQQLPPAPSPVPMPMPMVQEEEEEEDDEGAMNCKADDDEL
eukprot:jgi/Undpi1/10553/HiC_scaffold_29.g13003.m1